MFLCAWVLYCTLEIANLQRVAVVNKTHYNQTCKELLIHENFIRTTVDRDSPQTEYCVNDADPSVNVSDADKPINLDQLIDLYKTFNFTNSYEHVTPNSPINQSGVLSINDHQELPLFLKADIRHQHIRINPDGVLGHDTDDQMALMGQLTTDDRVCLLPRSLGGPRGSNVVPMAQNVYLFPGNVSDRSGLNPPLPTWKSNEDWILRFLQTYEEGRVAWSMAVQYADGVLVDPGRNRVYRPVGFSLQFSAYENHTDLNSVFYESNQTTFLNNNDDPCGRFFGNYTPPVPSECRPKTNDTSIYTEVGQVTSRDVWEKTHIVSFPYTIGNQTFFYGQRIMDGLQWFIQELLPNGKMGHRLSTGLRAFYYKVVFPFSIEGRQFFYSNRGTGGTYWFIQELLHGGIMGKKTADGNWYAYQVCVPYEIKDRQFFYCQAESVAKWFITELLPEGKMGKIISEGYYTSPVVFIFGIYTSRYLYSHDPLLLTWTVHRLFEDGTMGDTLRQGTWPYAHHISIPYSMLDKNFFFGKNLNSGDWFLQEIKHNADMGKRIAEGKTEERFEVVFAYLVESMYFLYGHNQVTKAWAIKRIA